MASNQSLADILKNADQLFDERKYQGTLDLLNHFEVVCFSIEGKDSESKADIKWRQGRAMYKLSKVDTKHKDELIRKGFALVDEARKINTEDFAIQKWFAILLDAKSELDGVKARVQ